MKFRIDFVTNSSSSSYSVTVGIKLKDGREISYDFSAPQSDDGDVGDVKLEKRAVKNANYSTSIAELIKDLCNAVSYEEDPCYAEEEDYEPPEFVTKRDEYSWDGLDSSPLFKQSAKKEITDLEQVESVFCTEHYNAWGEFIPDEAIEYYEKRYGTSDTGGSVDLDVRTDYPRDSASETVSIDGQIIETKEPAQPFQSTICTPQEYTWDAEARPYWVIPLGKKDLSIEFKGRTFFFCTNYNWWHSKVEDALYARGAHIENRKLNSDINYFVIDPRDCKEADVRQALRLRANGSDIQFVDFEVLKKALGLKK